MQLIRNRLDRHSKKKPCMAYQFVLFVFLRHSLFKIWREVTLHNTLKTIFTKQNIGVYFHSKKILKIMTNLLIYLLHACKVWRYKLLFLHRMRMRSAGLLQRYLTATILFRNWKLVPGIDWLLYLKLISVRHLFPICLTCNACSLSSILLTRFSKLLVLPDISVTMFSMCVCVWNIKVYTRKNTVKITWNARLTFYETMEMKCHFTWEKLLKTL